jgi:hypothetical protein
MRDFMRQAVLLLTACAVLLPQRAAAAPIGTFEWVHDALFGTGSTFSVTNQSDDPFEDVFVDLFAPGQMTAFQSLSLGTVDAGSAAQSIDDLSFLVVPFDLSRALVRLTFDGTALSAELDSANLQGDPAFLLAGAIDIVAPDDPDPTPVPVSEPSTLTMLAGACLALALHGAHARRAHERSVTGRLHLTEARG